MATFAVCKYDEVWREAELLKYVLNNWTNKLLVVAKGPKTLVAEQLTDALHAMGIDKEKRLRVEEEDAEQGQAAKRARVAPEILSRIIEGLRMEDADKAMKE
ncbi:hypothetical protein G6F43_013151 [Rhizopus delemar]|nr:hypothetical protein G6F43_013151 [Rhizopus delemar]